MQFPTIQDPVSGCQKREEEEQSNFSIPPPRSCNPHSKSCLNKV
ncbi:unnamed protein product [Acanthoscelides obtectus]|uniref:Uncharacterized protein n=1 Tax=Acanthoscelides obtectus TaxID=200917 RepID=A0A9P0LDK0_ACAOB|nr:unnamed protein product [Acanthoscelides obtectus]CAK1637947.1 hypothetical protein AOBTE_LOCUS10304 [Acanthoscelides obtectus]